MKTVVALLVLMLASQSMARLTYDLGYSFGDSNNNKYAEFNLGVNYFFNDYMVWRNSGFHRDFNDDAIEDRYGLDTSMQFNFVIAPEGSDMNLKLFGGPGWRFISEGKNPPFAEGGVGLGLGPLKLRVSVKSILHELIDDNLKNETQYTIGISARGVVGD